MKPLRLIRNFSIIAHIDHGKSTLSDRFIQKCGALSDREMREQILDSMDLERERGITIKAHSVTLHYKASDNEIYQLNFIDTPGHVDFSYEVSRSLAACEGALLVVDAGQGVQAQTLAVCNNAIEQGLEIVPVLNKIDLPQAEPERVIQEIEEIVGIPATDAILVSAKTGVGIDDLLEAILTRIPAPEGNEEKPLQGLIVDSWFDNYLGVVSLIRVMHGRCKVGERIRIVSTGKDYLIDKIGKNTPKPVFVDELGTGEVGFIVAGIKDISAAPVGDTITSHHHPCDLPLPGFKRIQPRVFAGLYPIDSQQYNAFRDALAKLKINDDSLFYEPESSDALGLGFRCGFLGMLHMEIVQERLEREYNLELITTAPTVVYEVELTSGKIELVENPSKLPSPSQIQEIREPMVNATILVPAEYLGAVIQLCIERRGIQKNIIFTEKQVSINFHMPLNEIILDFFDKLKSVSRGYASLDYELIGYQLSDLVKLEVLINGDKVDSLATIVYKDKAYHKGKKLTEKLKDIIPRQMFEVAIQAAIGNQIIARSTVKAMRKNVTAKCYGGDVTRKRKLLEKQKAGKKRMKQIGRVTIPQAAFLAVMKVDEN